VLERVDRIRSGSRLLVTVGLLLKRAVTAIRQNGLPQNHRRQLVSRRLNSAMPAVQSGIAHP